MKFENYISLDWAQRNMAIAHSTRHSKEISTIDVPSNIKNLKSYISQMKGTKILTFEESSPAQWLYTDGLTDITIRTAGLSLPHQSPLKKPSYMRGWLFVEINPLITQRVAKRYGVPFSK